MGRMVTAPIDGVSITAVAQDLWSLLAHATSNKIKLWGWELTSADTTAETVQCRLQRWTTTGSGGSAPTPEEHESAHGTPTGVLRVGDTTAATGTIKVLRGYQWEQLGPIGTIFIPEMLYLIEHGEGISLYTASTVAMTMSGWVCWEEL